MPFSRPALPELIGRVASDIEGKLAGTAARLRYTAEGVIGRAVAGAAHGLYGFLAYIFDQIFPGTAESYFMRKWADFYGLTPIDATSAHSDVVAMTGTNGSVAPLGTSWQRADGAIYIQDADATIVSGVATAAVTADVPGAAGNADAGTTLALTNPVIGINAGATLTEAASGGSDNESDASLLARLLQRLRNPPLGGAPGNYITWALEVAGVTRAWELPLINGGGTIGLTFVRDGDGDGLDIIPDNDEVADVQAHIDTVAPPGVTVVLAPTPIAVHFSLIVVPDDVGNTVAVHNAVIQELKDFVYRKGVPDSTMTLSQISQAISNADGVVSNVILLPSADVTLALDEIAYYDGVEWH